MNQYVRYYVNESKFMAKTGRTYKINGENKNGRNQQRRKNHIKDVRRTG